MASSSKTLEQLIAQMQQQNYTPLTQEQMQTQATNRYSSVYDQKRQSANQAYQTSDQALAQQLADLQTSYDKQREDTAEGFLQSYAQADRQALSRGMQRSSYNNATLANINLKGQEAQQDINEAQAAQEKNIGDQRTLYAQQLASQLASYDAQQRADELAYMDELEAREYDRSFNNQQAQNALALDLYNAQFNQEQADIAQQQWQTQFDYQKEQDALAQSNWLKQFNAQYNSAKSSGGGSSGRRSSNGSSNTSATSGGIFDVINQAISTANSSTQNKSVASAAASGSTKREKVKVKGV